MATRSILMSPAPPGTFASQDVGTGIMVTVTGLTISGAQAGRLHADPTGHDSQHHRGSADCHGHHGGEQGV